MAKLVRSSRDAAFHCGQRRNPLVDVLHGFGLHGLNVFAFHLTALVIVGQRNIAKQ